MTMNRNGTTEHPREQKAWVLYDPADGRIVHIHRTLAYAGAPKADHSHMEARAREVAAEHGHDVAALHALELEPERLSSGVAYRVDVSSRSLVEAAPPIRGS